MSASTRVYPVLALLALGAWSISTACTTFSNISDLGEGGAGPGGTGTPSGNGGAQAAAGNTGPTSGSGATTGSASSASGAGTGSASSAAAGPGSTAASSSAASSSAAAAAASSSSSGGGVDPSQLCVDTINMYRATLGLAPYGRWNAEETCGGQQAQKDYQAMTAHSAFQMCSEWAQNECPGWPSPAQSMITGCLAQMWAEGPGPFDQGHGHYVNMSSTQYTMVACGFYTTPQGDIWAVQDFK